MASASPGTHAGQVQPAVEGLADINRRTSSRSCGRPIELHRGRRERRSQATGEQSTLKSLAFTTVVPWD
ncbi:MAG: hypothetical protein ACKO1M_07705 [Planctomycetota bacterium]